MTAGILNRMSRNDFGTAKVVRSSAGTTVGTISREIAENVSSWADVSVHPHRFGGIEFRLGKREIGHLHGDSLLDIPFPMKTRDALIAGGRVEPHHVLPKSGWISYRLHSPADTDEAVRLLRLAYDLAMESQARRSLQTRKT